MNLYESNFVDGKVSYKELVKKFPLLKGFNCGCEEINNLDLGWKWFNLGAGNYLLIREEYYEHYKTRIEADLGKDYKKGELYQRWFNILQKVVIVKK
jgi:hypothetical protein